MIRTLTTTMAHGGHGPSKRLMSGSGFSNKAWLGEDNQLMNNLINAAYREDPRPLSDPGYDTEPKPKKKRKTNRRYATSR